MMKHLEKGVEQPFKFLRTIATSPANELIPNSANKYTSNQRYSTKIENPKSSAFGL
jgi:hypothetical protein